MLAFAARIALIATAALAGCDRVFEIEDVVFTPTDGSSFDASRDCPPSYSAMSPQDSMYRIVSAFQRAGFHNVACESDAPGLSHLAVIDAPGERIALEAALDSSGMYRWYIGAVQQATATTPDAGWLWLNGSPFDGNLWTSPEPDDSDAIENHDEQFAMLQAGLGMADFIGNNDQQALCECDGRPITDEARTAFDAAAGL